MCTCTLYSVLCTVYFCVLCTTVYCVLYCVVCTVHCVHTHYPVCVLCTVYWMRRDAEYAEVSHVWGYKTRLGPDCPPTCPLRPTRVPHTWRTARSSGQAPSSGSMASHEFPCTLDESPPLVPTCLIGLTP